MSEPIQVAVTRTVKSGCEAEFEEALHNFVQRSLSLPGQLGVSVLRPVPGSGSRQYGILRKFSDRDALKRFRASPEYLEWTMRVANLTEGESHAEELNGLESWLTLPGHPLKPLPQWKMALVTYIAVDIVTTLLFYAIGPVIQGWPFLIRNSVFNILVVAALTWIAMPLLTRIFNRWLKPKEF